MLIIKSNLVIQKLNPDKMFKVNVLMIESNQQASFIFSLQFFSSLETY
jgi:hypothetical protein